MYVCNVFPEIFYIYYIKGIRRTEAHVSFYIGVNHGYMPSCRIYAYIIYILYIYAYHHYYYHLSYLLYHHYCYYYLIEPSGRDFLVTCRCCRTANKREKERHTHKCQRHWGRVLWSIIKFGINLSNFSFMNIYIK